MFQLTAEEVDSQSVTLKAGRGRHRKYRPFAFTEQGVACFLARFGAVQVNIQIMRGFVRLFLNPINDLNGPRTRSGGLNPSVELTVG
jgi:hypothetical protein